MALYFTQNLEINNWKGPTMKPNYINMGINFSILGLLIYLTVTIHEIKGGVNDVLNPPKYSPASTQMELRNLFDQTREN